MQPLEKPSFHDAFEKHVPERSAPSRRRDVSVRLLVGAALLLAGFGAVMDDSLIHNRVVQSAAGLFDFRERQCFTARVAPASACPVGCHPAPLRKPEDRLLPPECHSALWLATCGDACDVESGYVRLRDGRLADATRLSVVLDRGLDAELERLLSKQSVRFEARFDGLYRYDAVLPGGDRASLEKTKKRLSALPGVRSVDYVLK